MAEPGAPVWVPKRSGGRRLFLGFPPERLAARLEGLDARVLGPPAITEFGDVRVQPVERQGHNLFFGGVYQDGRFVEELALRRGSPVGPQILNRADPERTMPPEPAVHLPRAWYGGWLFNHYGHFLLESLARVLDPEVRASADPILYLNPRKLGRAAGWMTGLLRWCGIDPARLRLCDGETQVDRLLVQEPSFVVRESVRPSVHAGLPKVPGAGGGGTLYLSRGNDRLRRQVVGETVLEEALVRTRGAAVLRPETLEVTAQMRTLAGADLLIGCEGSAFHTLLFTDPAPRTILLCDGRSNLNFLLTDELIRGDVAYVLATDRPGGPDGWTIDVERALAGITEAERLLG